MKRRWIIRSFFVWLLLLFVGGWVASYFYLTGFEYRKGRTSCFGGSGKALIFVGLGMDGRGPPGLAMDTLRIAPSTLGIIDDPDAHSILGFCFVDKPRGVHGDKWWFLGIPYWFPTLISAALLLLVWRKTRPKINPETAFPVEVGRGSEKL